MHVGAASFQPVVVDNQLRAPGEERFLVSPSVLGRAAETKRNGGRVIAVGTTVVRALESAARSEQLSSKEGCTGLFIRPGFEFKVIDGLITNFHQPGTTHLLLVEALMGKEFLHRVYQEALSSEYRFLSYGDGMFIS